MLVAKLRYRPERRQWRFRLPRQEMERLGLKPGTILRIIFEDESIFFANCRGAAFETNLKPRAGVGDEIRIREIAPYDLVAFLKDFAVSNTALAKHAQFHYGDEHLSISLQGHLFDCYGVQYKCFSGSTYLRLTFEDSFGIPRKIGVRFDSREFRPFVLVGKHPRWMVRQLLDESKLSLTYDVASGQLREYNIWFGWPPKETSIVEVAPGKFLIGKAIRRRLAKAVLESRSTRDRTPIGDCLAGIVSMILARDGKTVVNIHSRHGTPDMLILDLPRKVTLVEIKGTLRRQSIRNKYEQARTQAERYVKDGGLVQQIKSHYGCQKVDAMGIAIYSNPESYELILKC